MLNCLHFWSNQVEFFKVSLHDGGECQHIANFSESLCSVLHACLALWQAYKSICPYLNHMSSFSGHKRVTIPPFVYILMRIALYSQDGKIRIPKSLEQNAALNNRIVQSYQSILKSVQNENPTKISIVFQLQNRTGIKNFLFSATAQVTVLGMSLLGSIL